MYQRAIFIIFTAIVTCQTASADLVEYHGGSLFWGQAIDNDFTTIDFTDNPVGTFITNQYEDVGVIFTNVVNIQSPSGFSDGHGLVGLNGIRMEFDSPYHAIAVLYLGVVMFELSYQGEVVATSSQFSVGGQLKFAGIISDQPFDEVYMFAPNPPFSSNVIGIDNLYWGAPIPTPGALGLFALAAIGYKHRRR